MEIAILNARVSRTVTMAKVDGRSAFGRLIRQVRSDLIQHVGGKPTAVQRMLIERLLPSPDISPGSTVMRCHQLA
jgi:hypothetical protein